MDFVVSLVNRPWFFPALGGAVLAYVLTLSTVLAIWTARDLKRRTSSLPARLGVTVFVFAFGIVGFLAYVALRPRRTLEEREDERRERALLARAVARATCPSCRAEVETDFASCPFCKVDFAPVCTGCGSTLQLTWKRCGFCGVEVAAEVRARKFLAPLPIDIELLEVSAPKLAAPKSWPMPFKKEKPATTAATTPSKPKPAPINGKAEKLRSPEPAPKKSNLGITLRKLFAIKA